MVRANTALITGAASGIGRAVADRMVRDGYQVLSVDLRPDPDGPGVPFETDLTDAEANAAAVAAALERFGSLDVIVAGAGIQHVAPIREFPVERWNTIIALMLTSPFLLARAGWEALTASGSGRLRIQAKGGSGPFTGKLTVRESRIPINNPLITVPTTGPDSAALKDLMSLSRVVGLETRSALITPVRSLPAAQK